jgi:hypothetical protein
MTAASGVVLSQKPCIVNLALAKPQPHIRSIIFMTRSPWSFTFVVLKDVPKKCG